MTHPAALADRRTSEWNVRAETNYQHTRQVWAKVASAGQGQIGCGPAHRYEHEARSSRHYIPSKADWLVDICEGPLILQWWHVEIPSARLDPMVAY